jgi:hypothetical protein
MSNRDRIAHLRAEADATAREKAAAKADKAAQPAQPAKPRKAKSKTSVGKSTGRVRIVWFVCDPSGKEVKRFPYAQEKEAREEALQQATATGRTYFVKQADVPFE